MQQSDDTVNAFLSVLDRMQQDGFLPPDEADRLRDAYGSYVRQLRRQYVENFQKSIDNPPPEPPVEPTAVQPFWPSAQGQPPVQPEPLPPPAPPRYRSPAAAYPYMPSMAEGYPVPSPRPVYPPSPPKAPPPERRVLTREEVTERNITYILNIGVLLVLLSGVIFGTTTWDVMSNVGKVILLCSVSVLFFIISVVTRVLIKIPRSSHAFWIMGSSFLPISLLSISFFRLVGDYFSWGGEGQYLYGALCSLICLPVYLYSALRNRSRVFAWIAMLNVSALFIFLALALHPSGSVFVLMLMGYNALLLAVSVVLRHRESLPLVLSELPQFLQVHLLLSTLVALLVFDSSALYSVNIVAASLLFYTLSFTQNKSGYDYVFGLLFTGGMLWLSRDIPIPQATLMTIPFVGYVFTGLSLVAGGDSVKSRRFQLFAALSTLPGFVYMMVMTADVRTVSDMLIGWFTLSAVMVNYAYLAWKTREAFFGAMIPIQFTLISYQIVNGLARFCNFQYETELLLALISVMFVVGYLLVRLRSLQLSALILSLLNTLGILVVSGFAEPQFLSLPMIGLVLTAQLFVVSRRTSGALQTLVNVGVSLAWFASLCLVDEVYSVAEQWGIAPALFAFLCALVTFALHFLCVKGLRDMRKPLFYTGQLAMAVAYFYLVYNTQLSPAEGAAVVVPLIFMMVYAYSAWSAREREQTLWFYAGLGGAVQFAHTVTARLADLGGPDLTAYALPTVSIAIAGVYFLLRRHPLHRHAVIALGVLIGFLPFGGLAGASMGWIDYAVTVAWAAVVLLCLWHAEMDGWAVFPLAALLFANHAMTVHLLHNRLTALPVFIGWYALWLILDRRRVAALLDEDPLQADWYAVMALISVITLAYSGIPLDRSWLLAVIPGIMGAVWFFVNRRRFSEAEDGHRAGTTLFALSLLWPYYSLLYHVRHSIDEYFMELVLLPLIVMTYLTVKGIYRGRKSDFRQAVEYAVPLLTYIVLITLSLKESSPSHSIVLILTGLFSMLYASAFRVKSALFLGGGVILTTVLVQTRTYWLNFQWWVYLLIVGSVLILIASVNEYRKNRSNTDVMSGIKGFFDRFSDWE